MASQEVECLLRVVELEAESRIFVLLAFLGVADSRDSLDALDEMASFLDDLGIEGNPVSVRVHYHEVADRGGSLLGETCEDFV